MKAKSSPIDQKGFLTRLAVNAPRPENIQSEDYQVKTFGQIMR